MAKKVADETLITIEDTQAALRDGIERAKELVCEAKLMLRPQRDEIAEPAPPNPATYSRT